MSNEKDAGEEEFQVEASALSRILSSLQLLSDESRARVLRSALAFFDISMGGRAVQENLSSPRQGISASLSGGFSEDRTLSPKEFLFQKRPARDIDRIACLAYYLTHFRDTARFKTLDLSKLNTEAAQIKFSRDVAARV